MEGLRFAGKFFQKYHVPIRLYPSHLLARAPMSLAPLRASSGSAANWPFEPTSWRFDAGSKRNCRKGSKRR